MIRKLLSLLVFLPLGLLLIVLSVANRQSVQVALNPFDPTDPVLSIAAPLFVLLILAVMFGVVVGAIITWFTQAKYRKRARTQSRAAQQWQAEADRQKTRAEQIAGASLPSIASS